MSDSAWWAEKLQFLMKQLKRRQKNEQFELKHITVLILNALKRLNLSENFNRFTEILITQIKHSSHLTVAVINLKYSLK